MTEQERNERVRTVVQAPLSEQGLEVVDIERQGSILRITLDRPGGIDTDALTAATRLVSDLVDRHELVGERTTLEVSSPGIERPLRTPEHFLRFVGTEVAVKLLPGAEGDRRFTGLLEAADDDGVVVGGRRLAYADIDKARTVFVWPAGGQKTAAKKMGRAS